MLHIWVALGVYVLYLYICVILVYICVYLGYICVVLVVCLCHTCGIFVSYLWYICVHFIWTHKQTVINWRTGIMNDHASFVSTNNIYWRFCKYPYNWWTTTLILFSTFLVPKFIDELNASFMIFWSQYKAMRKITQHLFYGSGVTEISLRVVEIREIFVCFLLVQCYSYFYSLWLGCLLLFHETFFCLFATHVCRKIRLVENSHKDFFLYQPL